MLAAVTAFSIAAAFLVILPGPDTLVVIRAMVRGGRAAAVWTALGGLTGLVCWVSITVAGLAAILHASHHAYTALKIAGAAYLVWLGIKSSRSTGAASPTVSDGVEMTSPAGRPLRDFGAGLATNLLNPKIGVLFVALLPGFVPAGHSVAATSMLLGGIYIAETTVYAAVLIAMSGRVVKWMANVRIRRRLDQLMGAVFVGLGVQLAAKP